MLELNSFSEITPFGQIILLILYSVLILALVDFINKSSNDDDDDKGNGHMIPVLQRSKQY